MENTRNKYAKYLFDAAAVIAGAVLIFGVDEYVPSPGGDRRRRGMTGIATIIDMFFGVPVGVMIIILNIPLILLNTRCFGEKVLREDDGRNCRDLGCHRLQSPCFRSRVTESAALLAARRRHYGRLARDTARARVHDRRRRSCRLPAQEKVQKAPDRDASDGVHGARGCSAFRRYCCAASTGSSIRSVFSIFTMGKLADLMLDGSQHAELALIISKKPGGDGETPVRKARPRRDTARRQGQLHGRRKSAS